eukprot:4238672-Amphidinium_carterae.1
MLVVVSLKDEEATQWATRYIDDAACALLFAWKDPPYSYTDDKMNYYFAAKVDETISYDMWNHCNVTKAEEPSPELWWLG